MKIRELFLEQTIGTTGPTSGTPGQVQPVSQTPGRTDTQQTQKNQTVDANTQKLASTLKQNKVIATDKELTDFMSAYSAQAGAKTLTPDQQEVMAKLAPALLKDKTLGSKLDLQLKTMSQQQPGSAPQQMGQKPPTA